MKVGVVGLGGMGRHHAKDLRELKCVKEVLGCDLFDAARKKAHEELGLRSVADIASLLTWKPDAVFVVTQARAHAATIEPCLKAGVPVFTEKPLAKGQRRVPRFGPVGKVCRTPCPSGQGVAPLIQGARHDRPAISLHGLIDGIFEKRGA